MSRAIPDYFFIDDNLYQKLSIIKSESTVTAFSYSDMCRVWLSEKLTRNNAEKAWSTHEAARLLRVKHHNIQQAIKEGLVPPVHVEYDRRTLQEKRSFFKESDLFHVRDAMWDIVPKNRYGEPSSNVALMSEEELRATLLGKDTNHFIVHEGEIIEIFQA